MNVFFQLIDFAKAHWVSVSLLVGAASAIAYVWFRREKYMKNTFE
jgi:hypothetical protein